MRFFFTQLGGNLVELESWPSQPIPYLYFFNQCHSSVEEVFYHFICDREVAWQFFAPFNNAWVAATEELLAKNSVLHPQIIVRNARYIACPAGEDILKAIEAVPALEKSEKIGKTKIHKPANTIMLK